MLFIIVYEVGEDVKQEQVLGVNAYNARVTELQAEGFKILNVITEGI